MSSPISTNGCIKLPLLVGSPSPPSLHPCSHLCHHQQLPLHLVGSGRPWRRPAAGPQPNLDSLTIAPGSIGRVWARTNCSFNSAGNGSCLTGDCHGLLLCQANGSPPDTLAEFALNQFGNRDFYDTSLVDGFNVPMNFGPTASGCSRVSCATDINAACPAELRLPGGCGSPCEVFNTEEYCCTKVPCSPNKYSTFFRNSCPEAYSYPYDGPPSPFTCPSGTNYTLVFCP